MIDGDCSNLKDCCHTSVLLISSCLTEINCQGESGLGPVVITTGSVSFKYFDYFDYYIIISFGYKYVHINSPDSSPFSHNYYQTAFLLPAARFRSIRCVTINHLLGDKI